MKKLIFVTAISILLTFMFGCSETAKTPEWSKARILAEKLDHPSAIISDERNLYYVTGGTVASLNEGTSGVLKISLSGGQPVQIFKGFQKDEKTVFIPDTFVLANDEKFIYFSAGYIFCVSKDGGEPEQITAGTPTEMISDNENIYWHNYVGEGMKPTPIYTVPKKGGEAKILTDNVTVTGLEQDAENIFYSTPSEIFKLSKKDKSTVKIFSVEKGQIRGIVADTEFIYAQHWQDPQTQIIKINHNAGQISNLGATINIQNTFETEQDENYLYFVKVVGSFGYMLCKMSKTTGEVTEIDSGYLKSFFVGKDKIYFSDISNIYEIAK